jgi:hypothetical protein
VPSCMTFCSWSMMPPVCSRLRCKREGSRDSWQQPHH